jgi:hypothetical protein
LALAINASQEGLWSAIIRAAGASVSDTCKRSPTLA